MRGKLFAIGAFVLLLSACATLQSRSQLLEETLEGYGAALRWGDFQGALAYVDPAVRKAQPMTDRQQALYDGVRVAQYDASGPHATGSDTVEQSAQISLIVKSSQQVYSVTDHQTWHWDSSAHRWWLETGLPDITPK